MQRTNKCSQCSLSNQGRFSEMLHKFVVCKKLFIASIVTGKVSGSFLESTCENVQSNQKENATYNVEDNLLGT